MLQILFHHTSITELVPFLLRINSTNWMMTQEAQSKCRPEPSWWRRSNLVLQAKKFDPLSPQQVSKHS